MQPMSPNPVGSSYLSLEGTVTQYLPMMDFWRTLRLRLRNPFLEVRTEEFVEDLEGVSRRALGLLRSRGNDRVMRFNEQARSKPLRSPSYAGAARSAECGMENSALRTPNSALVWATPAASLDSTPPNQGIEKSCFGFIMFVKFCVIRVEPADHTAKPA